jgi:hypothetical protein
MSAPVSHWNSSEQWKRDASRKGLSRSARAAYAFCVLVSVAVWLPVIGSSLWIDETTQYWSIVKGFWQIPFRQDGLTFPAYSYILWLVTRVLGTSEIAMRIPSVLAMLAAAWLLYLAAREMFEPEVAAIAVVVFCLHRLVVFGSTDVGVYAFATLTTSLAILLLLRLRRSDSNWMAALLGLAAAGVTWFHLLFAVIVPALAVCFFVLKRQSGRVLWRQLGFLACGFAVGLLPVIPLGLRVIGSRGEHVFMGRPAWWDLIVMIAPGAMVLGVLAGGVVAAVLVADADRRAGKHVEWAGRDLLVCAVLALVPLLLLFGISVLTPLHVSDPPWHMLSAVPGIALCWAWLARAMRRGWMRLVFCVVVTAAGAQLALTAPLSATMPRDQEAFDVAQKIAGGQHMPVVVCSDYVESNFAAMPAGAPEESMFFAPLAYYRLAAPVVPLPRALNAEAKKIGGDFVERAAARRETFLALGNDATYPTLDWLAQRAARAYSARVVGVYDHVKVLEFTPIVEATE